MAPNIYSKIKIGSIIGIKTAFVSGIFTPLFIELITDIHKYIDGSQIKIFFLAMPSLYVAIAVVNFFLLVVPCVLGGCFQSFMMRDDLKYSKGVFLISGAISLISLPVIWKLYANGSTSIDFAVFFGFTYIVNTTIFSLFKK